MTALWRAIDENSAVAEARRGARQLAHEAGFDETAMERAAIVVTEACTNLLKHAGGGQLMLRCADFAGESGLEVLVLDRGPGMRDIPLSLTDGHTTTQTAGTGLGAIARLSACWDIYSIKDQGTVLVARVLREHRTRLEVNNVGVIQAPKPGEEVSGDDWGMVGVNGHRTVLVADGLGHGPEAARAARAAVEILYKYSDLTPAELVEAAHAGLRHTRGAAVAAAVLDKERRTISFAGVGNIDARVCAAGERARHMVSANGTAGAEARTIREFTYPWPEDAIAVLHSDGIGTHWDISKYPQLAQRDPSLIAGVIFRDFCRRTDDATVLVLR